MTSAEISIDKELGDDFKFYGICVNCDHKGDCDYRQNPDKPILFCEQFEILTPLPPKMSVKKGKQHLKTEVNDLRGLCLNCEKRGTCMFPKPEGGVWHCEEYI